MSFVRYIAQRYLFGKHRIPYIVFITRTAIVGMALGVATLSLAMAILRGFQGVVTDKIIGFDSHIRIEKLFESAGALPDSTLQEIANLPEVADLFPIQQSEIMLQAGNHTEGAILESYPGNALKQLYSISTRLQPGTEDQAQGLILGSILAESLGLRTGDYVLYYKLDLQGGSGIPIMAQTQVAGVYNSGMSDYDKVFVYSSFPQGETHPEIPENELRYGIFLHDLKDTDPAIAAIDGLLPYSHLTVSWRDRHETLFNWMRTQQLPILIIFSLIMLVAIVNIGSTLILIILEKRSEIGTLRALGTSRKQIRRIFMIEGLTLGFAGAGSGLGLALLLGWIQQRFGIISLPSDVYFMDRLAIHFSFLDVASIAAVVISMSWLFALIPAVQAAHENPVNILRYE